MSRAWSRLLLPSLACCMICAPISSTAEANEGQWTPAQITQIHERAARNGLELSADELWHTGGYLDGGLMRASVNLSGCSAAFISSQGLISTNHHCAYSALQANSSVEHDYLEDGFLAAELGDELEAKGKTVKVLMEISDVTEQLAGPLRAEQDDRARAKLYSKLKNQLVDDCEAETEHAQCQVASFFLGSRFELHRYMKIQDLRLVYAPPSAIGEYGGEIDNWMWPRHTGDFTLLRAYVGPGGNPAPYAEDNIPFESPVFLKPATEGVKPGDFVGILGYPGRTERYLWAAELERHLQGWLPMRVVVYGEWIELLEQAGGRSEEIEIKVAALKKSLANRHKNAAGKIAGLERLNLVATRQAEDKRLLLQDPAKPTLEALGLVTQARSERAAWAFLLHNLGYGPRSLVIARDLAIWAQQRAKPDIERKSGYRDRDRDRVWNRIQQYAKDADPELEAELLASFLTHADALEGQRIAGFDKLLKRGGGKEPAEVARAVLEGSKLTDLDTLEQLFENPKKIKRSRDPVLALARDLVVDLDTLSDLQELERGQLLRLSPAYFELVRGLRGAPLYSDANSTLRFSHATVQGYTKWKGEEQAAQTVLAGAVAKHTGGDDFNLPQAVLDKAKSASESRWADPELHDVPVCFLADGDTTGGNSGSPVIDARGNLVGFNFDRVWENVAGDYAWRSIQSRNVIADVRYLYWMLEEVAGSQRLLQELGVADYEPPAPPPAAEPTAEPTKVVPPGGGPKGCGCVSTGPSAPIGPSFGLLGLLGLLGLRRGRRRCQT